jgi:hypothetical protein
MKININVMKKWFLLLFILVVYSCGTYEEERYYSVDGKEFSTLKERSKYEKYLNKMFFIGLETKKAKRELTDYENSIILLDYEKFMNNINACREENINSNNIQKKYLMKSEADTMRCNNGMYYYYKKSSNEDFLRTDSARIRFNGYLFSLDSLKNTVGI